MVSNVVQFKSMQKMHGCRNSKKILLGYLHGSYRGSTRALVARIDHNLEEFDKGILILNFSTICDQMIFLLIS